MNMLALQERVTEEFYSREGYRIRLDDERWKLNKDFSIPIFVLASVMDAQMYLSFRHVLAFYAKCSGQLIPDMVLSFSSVFAGPSHR